MFLEKRAEAVLESKAVIENRNAPLIDGGDRSILFVYSEKSGSFLSRDMIYTATFRIGKRRKEFRVDKNTYERLEENKTGILIYSGDVFVDFILK